jgi:hypothetical protein
MKAILKTLVLKKKAIWRKQDAPQKIAGRSKRRDEEMKMKINPSPQQRAELRVCASCEWIFKGKGGCLKCHFGTYGARFVYGDKAYRYAVTQKPWFDKKIADYSATLFGEIRANKTPRGLFA